MGVKCISNRGGISAFSPQQRSSPGLCCLPCRDSSANTTPPLLCPTPTPSKVVLCRNHLFSSSARKQHCWQAKTIQPLEQLSTPATLHAIVATLSSVHCRPVECSPDYVFAEVRLPARTMTRSAGSTDALPLSRILAFARSTHKTLRKVSFLLHWSQPP